MRALRDELAPVRLALGSFQREKDTADYRGLITIFGKAHTADSKGVIDDRVHDAIEVLRKVKWPGPPQFLVIKPVFNLVKSAASLFSNLVSASPGAFGAAKDVFEAASAAKELQSFGDSSAFVEVHHRLGWTLRQWFNPGIRLEKLFGPIQGDEPRNSNDPTTGTA
jgi:hypothetical protein